jgi:hypothetical protein
MDDEQIRQCFEFVLSLLRTQVQSVRKLTAANSALLDALERSRKGFGAEHEKLYRELIARPDSEAYDQTLQLIDELKRQLRSDDAPN